MIQIVEGLPDNVVAILVKRRVTNEDCDKVLKPLLENLLKRHDKVRLYYEIRLPLSRRSVGRPQDRDRQHPAMGAGGGRHRCRLGQAHGERTAVRDPRRSPRVPDQSVISGVRLDFVSVVMTSEVQGGCWGCWTAMIWRCGARLID